MGFRCLACTRSSDKRSIIEWKSPDGAKIELLNGGAVAVMVVGLCRLAKSILASYVVCLCCLLRSVLSCNLFPQHVPVWSKVSNHFPPQPIRCLEHPKALEHPKSIGGLLSSGYLCVFFRTEPRVIISIDHISEPRLAGWLAGWLARNHHLPGAFGGQPTTIGLYPAQLLTFRLYG